MPRPTLNFFVCVGDFFAAKPMMSPGQTNPGSDAPSASGLLHQMAMTLPAFPASLGVQISALKCGSVRTLVVA